MKLLLVLLGTTSTAAPPLGDLYTLPLDLPDYAVDRIQITAKTAQRPRIAGSAQRIDEEALERFEYDDVHKVLVGVPGVYVRGEDGYGLRPNIGLRGASSDRSAKVTLMEDGVLFGPAPYSAPAAYYFPLTTRMRAIEVYKGPGSVRYGPHTVGGALDLRTRGVPSEGAGGLDLGIGTERFLKLHGHYGDRFGRFGLALEGVHLETTGFKDLDGGGDTGFAKNETALELRWDSDRESEVLHGLALKLGYADERSDETYLGLTEDDFRATPYRRYAASARDRMEWWRTQVALRYSLNAALHDLDVVAYRHDFSRAWTKLNKMGGRLSLTQILANPSDAQAAVLFEVLTGRADSSAPSETLYVGTNDRRFVSEGVQATWAYRPDWFEAVKQEIELGLRFHHDQIRRLHDEGPFSMRSATLVPGGEPEIIADNEGRAFALAAHLVDELTIGELLLTPGVRVELIHTRFAEPMKDPTESLSAVVVPGLGASYRLVEWLDLLAGVHRGFSPAAPSRTADVAPESSIAYEAGARASIAGIEAELIGFLSDYSDLIVTCTNSSGCGSALIDQQFNAGRVLVLGLEAMIEARHRPSEAIELIGRLSYTFTRSRFLGAIDSPHPQLGRVEEGDELPYVPEHQGSLELGIGGPRWTANAALRAVTAMRNEAGQGPIAEGEGTDGNVVLDLSGTFAFTAKSRIYLNVDNALDADYVAGRRPYGARPGRPISAFVGYKHEF